VKKSFNFKSEDKTIGIQFDVSSIEVNGTVWMLANPFAKALEYARLNKAIATHVSVFNKIEYAEISPHHNGAGDDSSFQPTTKFINRAGLFELISKSRMSAAKGLQDWVTGTLLPTLTDTGKYDMTEAPPMVQNQMNVIHQLTNDGAPASWYEQRHTLQLQLLEAKNRLLLEKDEKEALYKKIIEVKPLIVSRPNNKRKFHRLEIFHSVVDGKHCYQGIRAQEMNIKRQRRSVDGESIFSEQNPNAINAFNRVKDLIVCKAKRNKIFSNVGPDKFLETMSSGIHHTFFKHNNHLPQITY